jgi:fructokinase
MIADRPRVVCFGEVLVDFVAEDATSSLSAAPSFTPRFGGSQANVAVGAARFGADSAFVGGAGDDPWGRWLRERLVAEGVDSSRFALLDGVQTPHAFVSISGEGEPEFAFFGDREQCVVSARWHLSELLEHGRGVFTFGSDTLITPCERELTTNARRLALERGWRVLYDPNLRPRRWPDRAEMVEIARALIASCTLVKANLEEASAMTGEVDPAEAANALVGLGCEAAVVTIGAGGAIVAAAAEATHVPAAAAQAIDTTGAGDAVTAVIAASLARGLDLGRLPAAVELAVATAGRVVEARGALDGLPAAAEARAALDRVLA